MPSIWLHTSPSDLAEVVKGVQNPLPQLLQTPSGLALLELQGTINIPSVIYSDDAQKPTGERTFVGRLVFPDYIQDQPSDSVTWMKRVYLYVGRHQRLTGEVKRLVNPVAVIRRRNGGEASGSVNEALEILEIVYYKVLFSSRPDPVSND